MVHENVDIPIVVMGLRQETPGHVSLVFARPPAFDCEAGDWVDLAFTKELSGGKTYSLSSAPTDRSSADSVHLIYLNRTADFLFREELEHWQKQLPAVSIDYVVTQGMKSKERRRLLRESVDNSVHYYYIAGPPAMIESTEVVLMSAGVDHGDIRVDTFDGY